MYEDELLAIARQLKALLESHEAGSVDHWPTREQIVDWVRTLENAAAYIEISDDEG